MKSIVKRVVGLSCFLLLLLGWSNEEAYAESTWPSKCEAYGEIKPNQNPSFQHINCLLTNAALDAEIPPEVVKAVATQESGWRQFDEAGEPVISHDGGIGIMQITNHPNYDERKLKHDIYYNIQAGVDILSSMYDRRDLPKIKNAGREVIENWYFSLMAYNGTKPVNSPLYQSTGTKNKNAYQEKVFAILEKESYLKDTELGQFPFSTADFKYNTDSDKNIEFKKKEYTLTDEMHASTYHYNKGDKVVVTEEHVKLRSEPITVSDKNVVTKLAEKTTLIIAGEFSYNQFFNSKNQFVWYPVKTADQKLAGYISSAYIMKKLEKPFINPVYDNDLSLSGKAPVNTEVQIKRGTKLLGSTGTDAKGHFKTKIASQKAGTKLTVVYKGHLNVLSPAVTRTVIDKTVPAAPKMNKVTDKDKKVTGRAEAKSVVQVKKGKSTLATGKTNSKGMFSVTIPKQKAGTKLSVRVKDSAGNYSRISYVTVQDKTNPAAPKVNKVADKSTKVTGKAEANTIVQVKKGKSTLATGKTNSKGMFSVTIPKQKAGTKLSVRVKDSGGNHSPFTTVLVNKK